MVTQTSIDCVKESHDYEPQVYCLNSHIKTLKAVVFRYYGRAPLCGVHHLKDTSTWKWMYVELKCN